MVDGFLAFGDGIVRGIFDGQFFHSFPFFAVALQNADLAEYDHTAEVRGVFLRYDLILADDAEGSLGAFSDGV